MTGTVNVDYGPAEVAFENEVLRSVVGSGVHGIAIDGTDDHDEMGIFIEPQEFMYGLRSFDYKANTPGFGGAGEVDRYVYRSQPEGVRSGPGDLDLTMYSLRKYLRMAAKGNPTALLPLFAPAEALVVVSPIGESLRDHAGMFLSQQAVHRFVGYLDAQHERMLGGGKQGRVPSRPELVEAYGYDTKYAAHAYRLAVQGWELVTTGALTLPLPEGDRETVVEIKTGCYELGTVSDAITGIRDAIVAVLESGETCLPVSPDWESISEWSMDAHEQHWGYRVRVA